MRLLLYLYRYEYHIRSSPEYGVPGTSVYSVVIGALTLAGKLIMWNNKGKTNKYVTTVNFRLQPIGAVTSLQNYRIAPKTKYKAYLGLGWANWRRSHHRWSTPPPWRVRLVRAHASRARCAIPRVSAVCHLQTCPKQRNNPQTFEHRPPNFEQNQTRRGVLHSLRASPKLERSKDRKMDMDT